MRLGRDQGECADGCVDRAGHEGHGDILSPSASARCRGVSVRAVRGLGTLINVVAVLAGSGIGMLVGNRLPERTRSTVTDALGLITLIVGALNVAAIGDAAFGEAVGEDWTLIVVLGAVVVGGIIGSLLGIEPGLERLGAWLQRRFAGEQADAERARFIEGYVSASLLFCVGPLTVLGSLSDGLGNGIDQLVLKSSLDLLASMAFAASLGLGVALSAVSVLVFQGALTILGAGFGSFMPDSTVAAMTATGGVLLLGIGLRLLRIRQVAVADLLPALVLAPIITAVIAAW
jgi:uncharacterized membrane protein YqgA involved in biofilm formation